MHTYVNRSPTRNQRRQQKLVFQKLMGVALLVISIVILAMAGGSTPEECDCTALLLSVPAAIFLLVTKHVVIC